jgi:hypothetical protein
VTDDANPVELIQHVTQISVLQPDARTNKPIGQQTIYALALTRLVPSLRLFDIKCAWFNENCYNKFLPRRLLPWPNLSRTLKDTLRRR